MIYCGPFTDHLAVFLVIESDDGAWDDPLLMQGYLFYYFVFKFDVLAKAALVLFGCS